MSLLAAVWQVGWVLAINWLMRGREFGSDAPAFDAYVNDPLMLLTARHRSFLGGGVAAPLMPLELAGVYAAFEQFASKFVAMRLTMVVHSIAAMAITFWIAFRMLGPPRGLRDYMVAILIALVPASWVGDAILSQDDAIAALWSALSLAACVYGTPVAATVVTGLGVFFAKPFLAITFLAIWLVSRGRRRQVALVAGGFVLAYLGLMLWRDGGQLPTKTYIVGPYMGPSPYGIIWMIFGRFNTWLVRDIANVITFTAMALTAIIALRRKTSLVSTSVALYSVFFSSFYGIMPEYEFWCLPFVLLLLWTCRRTAAWGVFWLAWLHSFFGYAYKVVYGLNPNFPETDKPGLKAWYLEHIGIDVHGLQIALAVATVICSVWLAVELLRRDPCRGLPMFLRSGKRV